MNNLLLKIVLLLKVSAELVMNNLFLKYVLLLKISFSLTTNKGYSVNLYDKPVVANFGLAL